LLVIWMLPKLWRGVRAVVRRLSGPDPAPAENSVR
jgi:hypothetical protein